MYHPTSRVLTVLELLQARPSITGPELAARLEMDVRTVRRYIAHLQDVGIPIESTIGRIGGYRLRPGFKLPPLIFTEEEATAIMLGLLASSWLEIGQSSVAIEGALAKVSRVLPFQARERLQAVTEHLVLYPQSQQDRPAASLLIDLSGAIHASQRILIEYRSQNREHTRRKVEPYGLTGWRGHWYLGSYCCLRQDYRVFRLDRIQRVEILSETFEKAEDFDYETFIRREYNAGVPVKIEFHSDLLEVQQRIKEQYGTLTLTPTGVLFEGMFDDLPGLARYLTIIDLPFVVYHPPQLRAMLRQLGERILKVAATELPSLPADSN